MARKRDIPREAPPSEELECATVWLKHTDKNGHSHIAGHRSWNVKLFLASQFQAALKAGGCVEQVTEDDYKAWLTGQRRTHGAAQRN